MISENHVEQHVMPEAQSTSDRPGLRGKRSRHGFAVMSIIMVLAFMLVLTFVLSHAWRSLHFQQMQTVSDAAARAGAVELIDPWILNPAANGPSVDQEQIATRVLRSKDTAIHYMQENLAYQPDEHLDVAMVRNVENLPTGDLVAGTVLNPMDVPAVMTPWNPTEKTSASGQPVNALGVRFVRSEQRGNAINNWFGQLFSQPTDDLRSLSVATVSQKVRGFRPIRICDDRWSNVPVAPLAISLPNDNPITDWRMTKIRVQLLIDDGGDSDDASDSSDKFLPNVVARMILMSDNPGTDLDLLGNRLVAGLSRDDLASLGGQIVFGQSLDLIGLEKRHIGALKQAFSEVKQLASTRKLIWPVVLKPSEEQIDQKQTSQPIIGFVVGEIIESHVNNRDVTIIVRPQLIQTSTAILDPAMPENPWIGKVMRIW